MGTMVEEPSPTFPGEAAEGLECGSSRIRQRGNRLGGPLALDLEERERFLQENAHRAIMLDGDSDQIISLSLRSTHPHRDSTHLCVDRRPFVVGRPGALSGDVWIFELGHGSCVSALKTR
jgi:hypothetical protein